MTCPFECEFLQESRKHEKPVDENPPAFPNRDIAVTEKDLEENQGFAAFLAHALVHSAMEIPGAGDFTARETLAALIRTWRTLESGLYYESLPEDGLAVLLYRAIRENIEEFRRREAERGVSRTRDRDVLVVLTFYQRLELDRSNGKPRGRAFLNLLWDHYGASPSVEASSSLILP